MRNKNDDKLDISRLNDVIRVSKNILHIVYILGIVALVALGSSLLNDWGVWHTLVSIIKIISPLFIGFIIAWLLDPAVHFLQRKGVNRTLSTVAVFVIFISAIVLVFSLIIPTFLQQFQEIIGGIPDLIDEIDEWSVGFFDNLNDLYNYDFSSMRDEIYEVINNFGESIKVGLPTKIASIAGNVLSGGLNFVIGLIIGFYMLFDFNNVRKQLLTFVPKKIHSDVIEVTDRLNDSLKSYVQGTLLVTFLLFTFQSVCFAIAGLKAPIVFGMICAITNVIPYVGPYIGGVPAVLVGFTVSPLTGILSLVAVALSQAIESYVLTPIVMSKTMKLHPVTIIIGLLIFGNFFGILGMLFATPIISCLKILFQFLEEKFDLFDVIHG